MWLASPSFGAIEDFIADLKVRRGKDGYGVAQKTISAYKRRLGLLSELCPGVYLDEVDSHFLKKGFLPFLRDHEHDDSNIGKRRSLTSN